MPETRFSKSEGLVEFSGGKEDLSRLRAIFHRERDLEMLEPQWSQIWFSFLVQKWEQGARPSWPCGTTGRQPPSIHGAYAGSLEKKSIFTMHSFSIGSVWSVISYRETYRRKALSKLKLVLRIGVERDWHDKLLRSEILEKFLQ
jgi:hypothetical protein